MKLARRTFVVGGAHSPFIGKHHPDFVWKKHPDFGKRENPTLQEHLFTAARGALEATGADDGSAIDKAYVGNHVGELFTGQAHLGALLAGAAPGLALKPIMRVEGACASGGLATVCALDAIGAGADLCLVVGAEMQTTVSARQGAEYLASAAHFATQRAIDEFTFPALFARRAARVKAETDLTEADLDRVILKAYANGNKNPLAHMHAVKLDPATMADSPRFLGNPELQPHLRMADCSQVSDGGSAIVLASEEGLKKLGKSPADAVELLAYGHAAAPLEGDPADMLAMSTSAAAAKSAYESAGVGPEDVRVAEVHDCFSIAEVLMYEAVGFAERGGAAKIIREGATELGGRIPVNTGGGLMSFGHPVGATGVKQILEVTRQMRGECGDYQLPERPAVGLTANMGGDDRTAVVTILRRG